MNNNLLPNQTFTWMIPPWILRKAKCPIILSRGVISTQISKLEIAISVQEKLIRMMFLLYMTRIHRGVDSLLCLRITQPLVFPVKALTTRTMLQQWLTKWIPCSKTTKPNHTLCPKNSLMDPKEHRNKASETQLIQTTIASARDLKSLTPTILIRILTCTTIKLGRHTKCHCNNSHHQAHTRKTKATLFKLNRM